MYTQEIRKTNIPVVCVCIHQRERESEREREREREGLNTGDSSFRLPV